MSMIDVNGVRHGADWKNSMPQKSANQHIIPRFYEEQMETNQIDGETGLKVYRTVEYVELLMPGDKGMAPVKRVTLLADRSAIPFTQDAAGLHLQLPKAPVGSHAYVFKIEAQ